ncbi:Uu.00g048010.m01.CDS01 [Anthostomella pinea]|uniref:Uu.00g048010.m01.CDS01 n=1 Tax=Anthostomella pinea TaxID=933095 RepID=A0AAI8YES7_9PEZI|nr:Uu.00g048010.m01.CDS01 [Anthostomella pinea]
MEGLVSQLQSHQLPGEGGSASTGRNSNVFTERASPSTNDTAPVPADSEPRNDDDQLLGTCLDTFVSCMLPYFPIVRFAPGLTVEQLRCDRPLLLQAIACVAWPSPPEKRARAVELKRRLLEAYLVRQKPQQEDRAGSSGSLSYRMMPCMSLVGESFLDRPAPRGLHTSSLLALPGHIERRHGHDAENQLSPERRRAVLGCFALSSVVSGFFADMDAMSWTPQLEEVLGAMSTGQECLGDACLVLQVRLQLLCLEAVRLRRDLQARPSQAQPPKSVADSVTVGAEALLGQLQELRDRSNSTPSAHCHVHLSYAEIQILETIRLSSSISSQSEGAVFTVESGPTDGNSGGGGPAQNPPAGGYSDLNYMWQSILALGACTTGLLELPPSRFRGISFMQWEQLASCLVVLSNLDHVQDDRINMNLAPARLVVELPVLLQRIIRKLTLTAEEALEKEDDGTFTLLASRVRAFRSSIRCSAAQTDLPEPDDVSGGGGGNAARPYRPSQGPFQNTKIWLDQLFAV